MPAQHRLAADSAQCERMRKGKSESANAGLRTARHPPAEGGVSPERDGTFCGVGVPSKPLEETAPYPYFDGLFTGRN